MTSNSAASGFYGNLIIGDPPKTIMGGAKSATLDGSAGNMIVKAGSAGDTLIGAGGNTLVGGVGADSFVFHGHFGQETLYDFTGGSGANHDTLQFDKSVFADWAHLLGATKQVGGDLLITLDASDVITLKNVALSNFSQSNARFAA